MYCKASERERLGVAMILQLTLTHTHFVCILYTTGFVLCHGPGLHSGGPQDYDSVGVRRDDGSVRAHDGARSQRPGLPLRGGTGLLRVVQ